MRMCDCVFVPQVFDNYAVTVMIGGEPYPLGLHGTSGQSTEPLSTALNNAILYSFILCMCHVFSLAILYVGCIMANQIM